MRYFNHTIITLAAAGITSCALPPAADEDDLGTGETENGELDDGGFPAPAQSCAEAVAYNASGMDEVIYPEGDADYYAVSVEAGKFYLLWTETLDPTTQAPNDAPGLLDTVISVLNADGSRLLASADDAYPRLSLDSELVYRAEATETLCIKIEDWGSWAVNEPSGGPDFTYSFVVMDVDDEDAANTFDTETNDHALSSQLIEMISLDTTSNMSGSFVFGAFDDGDDVDVYRFTMPQGTVNLDLAFAPAGTGGEGEDGHGSTSELGTVEIARLDGTVLARVNGMQNVAGIDVPVEAGAELLLRVERPEGTVPGANDFYVLENIAYDEDNPREQEDLLRTNDTIASAERVSIDESGSGYLLGFVNGTADVDHFAFDAGQGESVELSCRAAVDGSGLLGATFAILDGKGNELQSGIETREREVWWSLESDATSEPVALPSAGSYVLRVSAEGQDAEVTSNFYRCGLFIVPTEEPLDEELEELGESEP